MATRTTTSGCVAFFCEFLPTKAECVFFVLLDCLGGISKQWIPTAMFDWWVVVTIKFQPCQTSVFLIIFWMTNVETTPLRLGAIPMCSTNIGRGESSNNNFWLKSFGSSYGYIPISHKSLGQQISIEIINHEVLRSTTQLDHSLHFYFFQATTGWLWCCTDLGFGPALGKCGSWYFVDLIPLVVCDLWEDFVGRNRTFEVCM